jgi:hypothetical protein
MDTPPAEQAVSGCPQDGGNENENIECRIMKHSNTCIFSNGRLSQPVFIHFDIRYSSFFFPLRDWFHFSFLTPGRTPERWNLFFHAAIGGGLP